MVKTIMQLLVIVVAGCILGAASNQIRSKGSLDWTRNYFPKKSSDTEEVKNGKPKDKFEGYEVVTVDEVVTWVEESQGVAGQYVIVDARNESQFKEGHIPGAIRCYHYEIDSCIDRTLEYAMGAELVVVYCNGGECSDSKYMYDELVQRGVPKDAMRLFANGWEAWNDNDHPVETGEGFLAPAAATYEDAAYSDGYEDAGYEDAGYDDATSSDGYSDGYSSSDEWSDSSSSSDNLNDNGSGQDGAGSDDPGRDSSDSDDGQ